MKHRVVVELSDTAYCKLIAEVGRRSRREGRTYPQWRLIEELINQHLPDEPLTAAEAIELEEACNG